MARPLRIESAGALYHVMSRGNERKALVRDDADRRKRLDWLRRSITPCRPWPRTSDTSRRPGRVGVAATMSRTPCSPYQMVFNNASIATT